MRVWRSYAYDNKPNPIHGEVGATIALTPGSREVTNHLLPVFFRTASLRVIGNNWLGFSSKAAQLQLIDINTTRQLEDAAILPQQIP